MYNDLEMIQKINLAPEVYLGRYSLQRLRAYLNGCSYANANCDIRCLDGFTEYIANQYSLHSDHDWASIIEFFSTDEKDAYNNFVFHFNKFTEKRTISIIDNPISRQINPKPLIDVIREVSYFPEIFLGKPSLELLRAFLQGCGYGFSNYDMNSLVDFNAYLVKRYSLSINREWDRILTFFSQNEREAYNLFIERFNEFLVASGCTSGLIIKRELGDPAQLSELSLTKRLNREKAIFLKITAAGDKGRFCVNPIEKR